MFGRREYHFVLTIRATGQDGATHEFQRNNVMKWSGTEFEAMAYLLSELAEKWDYRPESVIILFWSFKRNKL